MSDATDSYPHFSEIARGFAPGWFAAVMGTGVLAMTTQTLAARWPVLAPLAWLLQGYGNHGLWLALLAFMLLRSLTLGAFAWRLTRAGAWLRVA